MKTIISLALVFFIASCGGGGSKDSIDYSGIWDTSVKLSSNNCPNDVPILDTLTYVHTINLVAQGTELEQVSLVDNNQDEFVSQDSVPGKDSFIVTGSTHPLNPFVTGANCVETIIWSYFDIKQDGVEVFSTNVGRNSIISCDLPSGNVTCNVYYIGFAARR